MSKRFLNRGDVRADARRAAYDVTSSSQERLEQTALGMIKAHAWKINAVFITCAVVMGASIAYNYAEAVENRKSIQAAIEERNSFVEVMAADGNPRYVIYEESRIGGCQRFAVVDWEELKEMKTAGVVTREEMERDYHLHPLARFSVPRGCELARK